MLQPSLINEIDVGVIVCVGDVGEPDRDSETKTDYREASRTAVLRVGVMFQVES